LAESRENTSDADLLRAFARGDAAAFQVLYERHRAFVLRVALRFGGADPNDAHDVLQDTFTWLIRRASEIDLRHRLSTLLYPVARHLAADRRRRAARQPVPLEGVDEPTADLAGDDEGLRDWLDGLSPSHQEVVGLRYADGLSLDEIATALDVPLGTVKSRLHHALRILRERHGVDDPDA
jgi:RNA polymerase sigma-70 factor (ECF subfamily)